MKLVTDSNFAILILAAGTSKRLGFPKQLVKYKGATLLEHAVSTALFISPNVYVVLGYAYEECAKALDRLPVATLYNPNYAEGMGNTIAFGIEQLQNYKHVLIMLCDQPYIPMNHFLAMKDTMMQNPQSIISSYYNDQPGVPAIFPDETFSALALLRGDKGAKTLLSSFHSKYVSIESKYMMDIDSIEDLVKLANGKS
ncbi:nucleotidyltransferase family protein [Sulfuricurvum sp.]|uniref:nucleotidyltransferase family protein n=1 Tax=Sulfuricurvum sp. TaxID=2025608 RepID=UPI00262FCEBF|nr:nucleotidyltransferase family protein [Sulfuricurvum sp.]MDD2267315.1 nucleotidyltransferase family protein [Sulfuricurvum sp.]MDD2783937.1 nucleotidyltransferase family protein [Sulfuricurvum sp.]